MTIASVISSCKGTACAVRGDDIDTDRIIPARFMRCITFDGLGEYAFYDERFDTSGAPKLHPFNDPGAAAATMLVVNSNFGCGSSREHAPQALFHFGIRAIIGESFADIFAGNCAAIGMPAVCASGEAIARLMSVVERDPPCSLLLDLHTMTVTAGAISMPVTMPAAHRSTFLDGTWDTAATLLGNQALIDATARRIPYGRNSGS